MERHRRALHKYKRFGKKDNRNPPPLTDREIEELDMEGAIEIYGQRGDEFLVEFEDSDEWRVVSKSHPMVQKYLADVGKPQAK